MEWIEQHSATVWIRWGEYKADDDKDHLHSVPANTNILVEIQNIDEHPTDEGKYIVRSEILSSKGEKTGKIVSFTPPGRLQSLMGLNPNFIMDHIAQPGDIMQVTYKGLTLKTQRGKAHDFELKFAKK
jgi:hypothetical protein